ncbi:MAG: sugar ABC transporter permease [Clostridiales bacterium]|jgi:multiple sugar transport system permease protein|nr:sugar ABC transporter permease [Clostridiales bacterium]
MSSVAAIGKKKRGARKESAVCLCMALTPIIGFVIFGLAPMLMAIVMSTMKIRGFSFDNSLFVGLDNYKTVFLDAKFREAIINTFVMATSVPITLLLSLLIAILLNKKLAGTKIFRTIFFIPFACSAVALTTMWKWMYNTDSGLINGFLNGVLGITDSKGQPIGWVTDVKYFWQSMIIMTVWGGLGFNIILFTAALGNVPKVYYEAAKIDGASRPRQFLSITWPGISPVTFYLFTMGLIAALQEFARYHVMTNNLTATGKEVTIVYYLYKMFTNNIITQGMGMASATSLILGVMILMITALNFLMAKFWVKYD